MLSFAAPLLSLIRLGGAAGAETCLVCSESIRPSDERVKLPGSGHVHRGCATYPDAPARAGDAENRLDLSLGSRAREVVLRMRQSPTRPQGESHPPYDHS